MMSIAFSKNNFFDAEQPLRFERKYWFEKNQFFDWQGILATLPIRKTYPKRQVNSVYLDSLDLKSYHAAKNGDFERHKIRVRWYGDLLQKRAKAQLEIKYKQGELGGKKIINLKNFSFNQEMQPDDFKKNLLKLLPAELATLISNSEVILSTVYQRSYFQALENNLRVTIDEDLRTAFYFGKASNKHSLWNLKDQPFEVLELKYSQDTAKEGRFAHQIGQLLPLQLTHFSKYAWGVERNL